MAVEQEKTFKKEASSTTEKVTRLPKKAVLFVAEKSTIVTVPLGVAAIATGGVSLGLGAFLIGTDIISSKWAGNKRRTMK